MTLPAESRASEHLGVAVVGTGFMARVHSQAARAAGARLRFIVGSNERSSSQAAKELGFDASAIAVDQILTDDSVDIVHICTPNALHFDQARSVLEAGKHVVCEKPLALAFEHALELFLLSEGRVATVPFIYRFHPMVREARERVLAGEVGTLFSLRGSYLQDWLLRENDDNWRVDPAAGGASRAFADIGSHLVDLIEFVSGERIARVFAAKRTVFDRRASLRAISTEDAVCVVIETDSGAIGTLAVSQVAAGHKNHLQIELSGSNASVAFDQERPDSLWIGGRDSSVTVARDPDLLSADSRRLSILPAGHPMGYQDAFNAFVRDTYAAVGGAVPFGLPSFADGLRAVNVTDAVIHSSARGEWVTTPHKFTNVES